MKRKREKKSATKENEEKRLKISIKAKFVVLIVLSLMTAVSVSLLYMCTRFNSSLRESTQNKMVDYTDASSSKMTELLDGLLAKIKNIDHEQAFYEASLDPTGNVSWASSELNDFVKAYPDFISAALLSPEGNVITFGGEDIFSEEMAEEDYVKSVMNGAESGISNLKVTKDNEKVLFITVPVYNSNDSCIGLAAGGVDVSVFEQKLASINMSGMNQVISYIIDAEGNLIAHTDKEKVGGRVENAYIKNVLNNKAADFISGAGSYEENGNTYYAGCQVLDHDWVFVIAVPEEEVFAPIKRIQSQSIRIAILAILLFSVLGYIFAGTIANPIRKITAMLNQIADFNFETNQGVVRLAKSRDETGQMCNSILKMSRELRNVIGMIALSSEEINKISSDLTEISDQVNTNSNKNTETTQQMAAAMEETAATTENMASSVSVVKNHTKEIHERVDEGTFKVEGIRDTAEKLKESTEYAIRNTEEIFRNVKSQSDLAIEKTKAVDRINELTKVINEIADETGLLALNASIEAARAGEAGKGFAVVASEVGNLAKQSGETVTHIYQIIGDVNDAVESMSVCLKRLLAFVETDIMSDYKKFLTTSERYRHDAIGVNESMECIYTSVHLLTDTLETITVSIEAINDSVGSSSEELVFMADSNTEILNLTEKTYLMAQNSSQAAVKLKEIISRFQI